MKPAIDKIEALRKRIDDLADELRAAKAELLAAELETSPVNIGDLVKARDGKIYKITCVRPSFKSFWVSGNPQRKDGSFGTAIRHLYTNWERA